MREEEKGGRRGRPPVKGLPEGVCCLEMTQQSELSCSKL